MQIDATAADRALKAKERAQQGLGSDSEGPEPRYDNNFSRTASELSFTDEALPTGRASGQSGDESSEAAFSTRREGFSRPPASRERSSFKKVEVPPAADWTELLRSEKNGPGSVAKLVRTASNVSAQRAPRVPKQGASGPADPAPPSRTQLPKTDGKVSEGKPSSTVLPAESSSGSVVTAPGKPLSASEDEVLSKRSVGQQLSGEGATVGNEDMIAASGGVNRRIVSVKEPLEGAVTQHPVSTSHTSESVHTDDADEAKAGGAKVKVEHEGAMVRINSGLETVIPTSDSEEESVAATEGRRSSGSGDEKGALAGGETEGRTELVSESVQETSSAIEGDEVTTGSGEAAATLENENFEETTQPSTDFADTVKASSAPPEDVANEPSPNPLLEEAPEASKQESSGEEKKTASHQRNFSMREYLGQDLSVKEVETEGVDSDADSESGTDEETDSDSDDSEDERAAELQRQKEEVSAGLQTLLANKIGRPWFWYCE